MLPLLKEMWWTAEYVAEPVRSSPIFWAEVLQQDIHGWMALSYAPVDIRMRKKLMMQALKIDIMAFKYAAEELRQDRAFVLEAVRLDWQAIKNAVEELRADREIVLEAVTQDLNALEYASEDLRQDQEFLLEVLEGNARVFTQMPQEQRSSLEVLRNGIARNGRTLAYATEEQRRDKALLNEAMTSFHGSCSGRLWGTAYTCAMDRTASLQQLELQRLEEQAAEMSGLDSARTKHTSQGTGGGDDSAKASRKGSTGKDSLAGSEGVKGLRTLVQEAKVAVAAN